MINFVWLDTVITQINLNCVPLWSAPLHTAVYYCIVDDDTVFIYEEFNGSRKVLAFDWVEMSDLGLTTVEALEHLFRYEGKVFINHVVAAYKKNAAGDWELRHSFFGEKRHA